MSSQQEGNYSEVPSANEAVTSDVAQHVDPSVQAMCNATPSAVTPSAATPSAASRQPIESEAPLTHESYCSDAPQESCHESSVMPLSQGSYQTHSSNDYVIESVDESAPVTHGSIPREVSGGGNEASTMQSHTHEPTEEDLDDEEMIDDDEEMVDEDEEMVDEDEENIVDEGDDDEIDGEEDQVDGIAGEDDEEDGIDDEEDEEMVDEDEENIVDEGDDDGINGEEDEEDGIDDEEYEEMVDEDEENIVDEGDDDGIIGEEDEEDGIDGEEDEESPENDESRENEELSEANRALKEAELQERRQVCSEIIALRKELNIVQKDESNLREQLAHMVKIIDEHDPAVDTNVARLEEEAYNSQMQQLWLEKCEELNPDNMDWSDINIDNLAERTTAARESFEQSLKAATDLYTRLENEINKHTDYRETIRRQMKSAYDEEIDSTADVRARIKQIESEKKFHIKRGTTRRCQNVVVPEEKKTISRQRRIEEAELRTSAQIDSAQSDLTELMARCKVLKQQLDNNRNMHQEKRKEMEEILRRTEESGSEVREAKEKLLKEEAELNGLRTEMQGVLHYVRAKNRENEII